MRPGKGLRAYIRLLTGNEGFPSPDDASRTGFPTPTRHRDVPSEFMECPVPVRPVRHLTLYAIDGGKDSWCQVSRASGGGSGLWGAPGENRPAAPGIAMGQGDTGDVEAPPRHQAPQPATLVVLFVAQVP